MRFICCLAAVAVASVLIFFLGKMAGLEPTVRPRISSAPVPVPPLPEPDDFRSSTTLPEGPTEAAEIIAPAIDESFATILAGYSRASVEDRLAALRYLDADDWPETQRAALLALALADPVEEMRLAALLAVENGYFAAAFPLLDRALNDRSVEVREFAVDALAASGDPRSVPSLQRALSDRESLVGARVLDHLELLDPHLQQPVLLRALESPHDLIATTAIQALWDVATPEIIPAVLRLLDSPSPAKREESRRFLLALFNTSFVSRVEGERWWRANQARYADLLAPLAATDAR